jgi:hypothetical protein
MFESVFGVNQPVTTIQYLIVILLIGRYVMDGLRWIAPKTQTTADDQAVAVIDKAVAWGMSMAPAFWNIVEGADELAKKSGGKLESLAKMTMFIGQLRDAYRAQFGTEIPKAGEEAAKAIAAGLSAGSKLGNVIANPSTPGGK